MQTFEEAKTQSIRVLTTTTQLAPVLSANYARISRRPLFKSSSHSVIISSGPFYRKLRESWSKTSIRTQHRLLGWSYDIHIALYLVFARRWDFHLSVLQPVGGLGSISINCSLDFPRVVPYNAPIIELARSGDLVSMESMFQAGRASPTDVLSDGMTLLHVSVIQSNVSQL